MNRRRFLQSTALGASIAGLSLPRLAAALSGSDLRFVFLFNRGGWDPTRVFATTFGNRNVDMESDAERGSAGGIDYIAHDERPSVDAFFQSWADRCVVLNGVQVRSINHDVCTSIALTGSTSGEGPDWPAILGTSADSAYALPHLVLGGVSYPGELGAAVARTGAAGQLEALLSGAIVGWSDLPTDQPSPAVEGILDRYLLRRAGARANAAKGAADQAMAKRYLEASDKALALKDYRNVMDFTGGSALTDQAGVAVEALSQGLCRAVTLGYAGSAGGLGWDTHANNDTTQSELFEGLFQGLVRLMALLEATPSPDGAALSESTVLMVFSEMGRTPQLNATNGKDHWPYTSVLLAGPGLDGGRVVGDLDDNYAGVPVDYASGEADDDGALLSVEAVGATLLQLGGVDPADWLNDTSPITGILA